MSLFKLCTWWSAQCADHSDNYYNSCIICCRFGLDTNEKDYIVVGSYSGNLSIFYPSSKLLEDGKFTGYSPTDLVLEKQFDIPIIGLLSGKFSGNYKNQENNQIAILHPNSINIYMLSTIDGVANHGTQSKLRLIFEYKFNKTTFSFCKGHFGAVEGREFICITHMDSSLTLLEQDGISYECILPGEIGIPYNSIYIDRIDSFVRMNSSWELECFRYHDISQSVVETATINPIWSICIGEFPLDIIPVQITNERTCILILGEQNLTNISDEGTLEFIITFDFSPKCFHAFALGYYWEPNVRLIISIVSDSGSLLIYDSTKLIWATQFEEAPIAILRSNISGLPGGIITLSSTGLVHVGFLGSEPQHFKVQPIYLNEIDISKTQQELIVLEKELEIKTHETNVSQINESIEENLELKIVIEENLEKCTFEVDEQLNDMENWMCRIDIELKTKINMSQIQICFNLAEGIKSSKPTITFKDIERNSTEQIQIWFYIFEKCFISHTDLEIIFSCINKQDIPRVFMKKVFLPLKMFYIQTQPQKEALNKITISITSQRESKTEKLSSIFPEFSINTDSQAIGLQTIHDEKDIITIVTAKNTNRIRIQSDTLEIMAGILQIIINYYSNIEIKFNIQFENINAASENSSNIIENPLFPMNDIINRIVNHKTVGEKITNQMKLMDALWTQFKFFQRSLRMKADGESTDGIMMLIEKNYNDLVKEGDALIVLRTEENIKRSELSCVIALVKQIVSCLNVEHPIIQRILSILSFPIKNCGEKSWEEIIAPSFEILNHYELFEQKKFKSVTNSSNFATTEFDFNRFQRHLISVFDKVCHITNGVKKKENSSSSLNAQSEKISN